MRCKDDLALLQELALALPLYRLPLIAITKNVASLKVFNYFYRIFVCLNHSHWVTCRLQWCKESNPQRLAHGFKDDDQKSFCCQHDDPCYQVALHRSQQLLQYNQRQSCRQHGLHVQTMATLESYDGRTKTSYIRT